MYFKPQMKMFPVCKCFCIMKLSSCTTVYTIEDNIDLVAKLANKSMPTKEIISVPIGGGYGKNLFWNTFIVSQKLTIVSIFSKMEKQKLSSYYMISTNPVVHEGGVISNSSRT